ncbi:MAG: hypothetical protein RLP15_13090 [Cryomorphaceae bacterium]
MNRISLSALAMVFVIIGCTQRADEVKAGDEMKNGVQVINGVERAELALLMRKMYDEMALVKDSIKAGYVVKTDFLEEFKRIQTAHASEPEKIDETYQAMAEAFLVNYQLFESSQSEQVSAFNSMLQNCLICHEHKCPGPVKAIKKLKIKP